MQAVCWKLSLVIGNSELYKANEFAHVNILFHSVWSDVLEWEPSTVDGKICPQIKSVCLGIG